MEPNDRERIVKKIDKTVEDLEHLQEEAKKAIGKLKSIRDDITGQTKLPV